MFTIFKAARNQYFHPKRYLILAGLFVLYNLTGGFLPFASFPGPFILQYIITYGVALTMGVYLVHYIYKEYDIHFLNEHLTVLNLSIFVLVCFFGFYLLPYFVIKFNFYSKSMLCDSCFAILPVFRVVFLQKNITTKKS